MFAAATVTLAVLTAAHAEWNRAWKQKDAATIERIADAGFSYIGPRGETMTRAAVLAIIRSPGYRIDSARHSEYAFRALGPAAAALTFRWQGAGVYDGKPWRDDHRCTLVWVRRGAQWLAAHEQCSPIVQ
ncbi:MAG: nuclear transport factor 2 family protein [Acidobacteria bacterium]|nr:nuclear transport factor 2 family protein [Acidobacteriota bacterium]